MGFTEPEKEYKGKFPNDFWSYWYDPKNDEKILLDNTHEDASRIPLLKKLGAIAVSKYWFEDWVGQIRYGVIITDEEIKKLDKKKKYNIEEQIMLDPKSGTAKKVKIIEVGECSGFDEDTRYMFSSNAISKMDTSKYFMNTTAESRTKNNLIKVDWVYRVIEVKANEIFKDTGKLRHPRFLRMRNDKAPTECTWKDHVGD